MSDNLCVRVGQGRKPQPPLIQISRLQEVNMEFLGAICLFIGGYSLRLLEEVMNDTF